MLPFFASISVAQRYFIPPHSLVFENWFGKLSRSQVANKHWQEFVRVPGFDQPAKLTVFCRGRRLVFFEKGIVERGCGSNGLPDPPREKHVAECRVLAGPRCPTPGLEWGQGGPHQQTVACGLLVPIRVVLPLGLRLRLAQVHSAPLPSTPSLFVIFYC